MIRIKIICWSNVVLFCFFFHSILISFSSLLRSRVSGSTSQQLREAGETRFGAGRDRAEWRMMMTVCPEASKVGCSSASPADDDDCTEEDDDDDCLYYYYKLIYLYLLGPTEQKWKMQKQKPNTALGLVWLLVRLGSSFKNWFCVHFLSVLLPALSHPRPCDPKRPPPHPHPTVARFSCRSVVLPCSASCL